MHNYNNKFSQRDEPSYLKYLRDGTEFFYERIFRGFKFVQ